MGWRAVVVERQGRPSRRLLSRNQAVAGGGAAAAASRGNDPVGGNVRPLPRPLPPRRHLFVFFSQAALGYSTRDQSEWKRRQPLPRSLYRRGCNGRRIESAATGRQSRQCL